MRFKMPGLSKYVFTEEGQAIQERTGLHLKKGRKRNVLFYLLYGDNDNAKEYVPVKEIVAYGKHLIQELNIERCAAGRVEPQTKTITVRLIIKEHKKPRKPKAS